VVATTQNKVDEEIVSQVEISGTDFFCGSEKDVLGRYYGAAKKFSADVIVRITADCPLFDPDLLSKMLVKFKAMPLENISKAYLSNARVRTFPRGLDTEIFSFSVLEQAHHEAVQLSDREHVTPYVYCHPEKFILCDFRGEQDRSGYRWTLDTWDDFKFISAVYSELYKPGCLITTGEVYRLLQRCPELCELNAHVSQKPI
jgi:spore coat polysaccharide biosynthesis protein SpsF